MTQLYCTLHYHYYGLIRCIYLVSRSLYPDTITRCMLRITAQSMVTVMSLFGRAFTHITQGRDCVFTLYIFVLSPTHNQRWFVATMCMYHYQVEFTTCHTTRVTQHVSHNTCHTTRLTFVNVRVTVTRDFFCKVALTERKGSKVSLIYFRRQLSK